MEVMRSYSVRIFVGSKDLRFKNHPRQHDIESMKITIQKYVDEVGLCVSVTETEYIYSNGKEKGLIIELIQYPRFYARKRNIWCKAERLAFILMKNFDQYRITLQDYRKVKMLNNDI